MDFLEDMEPDMQHINSYQTGNVHAIFINKTLTDALKNLLCSLFFYLFISVWWFCSAVWECHILPHMPETPLLISNCIVAVQWNNNHWFTYVQ